jgi:hypothetical protein
MKYEDIKDFNERCEEHPDHQTGMISYRMIEQRLEEEIEELREYIEQRQWVGLTDEEIKEIIGPWGDTPIKGYTRKLFDQIEAKLREKNEIRNP